MPWPTVTVTLLANVLLASSIGAFSSIHIRTLCIALAPSLFFAFNVPYPSIYDAYAPLTVVAVVFLLLSSSALSSSATFRLVDARAEDSVPVASRLIW